jgi:hypothetical protein
VLSRGEGQGHDAVGCVLGILFLQEDSPQLFLRHDEVSARAQEVAVACRRFMADDVGGLGRFFPVQPADDDVEVPGIGA